MQDHIQDDGRAVHQGFCHFKKKKKEMKKGMDISFQKFEYVIITPQVERKKNKVMIVMLRKATKVHVYLQCFSLSLSKPERTS